MSTRDEAARALETLTAFVMGQDGPARTDIIPTGADLKPWYTWARRQLGKREVPGPKSNPEILAWMKDAFAWADDDSTLAWCGIFVKEALETTGYPYPQGFATARKWLDYGQVIQPGDAREGDIAVFWRGSPDSWKGHVGFYVSDEASRILVLGGNQSNSVSEAWQPRSKLLGIRRPRPIPA